MDITFALTIAAMCVGASFVQRVSGFGFGIFVMTMLPYAMPTLGEATTLSGLLAATTSAIITAKMWRHIIWRNLLPILATFAVASFIGVQLVSSINEHILRNILGIALIIASIYFLFIKGRFTLKPSIPVQISMGSLSGLLGGMFGTQGPPAVIYFLAVSSTKERYIALAQAYFLIGNTIMTLYRAQAGFLTNKVCISWCYGIAGLALGAWLGSLVFQRLSGQTLQRIIYIYIGINGLMMCSFIREAIHLF